METMSPTTTERPTRSRVATGATVAGGATSAGGATAYDAGSASDGAPTRGGTGASGAWAPIWRWTRKIAVAIGGVALLIVGAAMLVLPGPGIVVILMGLGLLATEFPWARRVLLTLRDRARQAIGFLRRGMARVLRRSP
jgi:hypothetical protein